LDEINEIKDSFAISIIYKSLLTYDIFFQSHYTNKSCETRQLASTIYR